MAVGTYKINVPILVTYQAIGCETGLTIQMNVYDELHALDEGVGQSGTMTEIEVDTGRYWKTFTPDEEGEWIVTMAKLADGSGAVVKAFAVAGHDVDSIGDAVAAVKAVTDVESGVKAVADAIQAVTDDLADGERLDLLIDGIKAVTDVESGVKAVADAVQAKTDLIGASVAPASEYDTEMARITADVATEAKQDVIDGYHDVPGEDAATDAQMRDVIGKKTDTVAGTSMVALAKQILADTGTTGSIRGADDDTLKTLSDQIDAVSAPAMVG